jgi:hypothetical protein
MLPLAGRQQEAPVLFSGSGARFIRGERACAGFRFFATTGMAPGRGETTTRRAAAP